ncbi:MAG: EVE domain-containing protein [SAR202 cluster bacterium]|nr:EVE domain-containing protein [SAR202 cluster bacterium]|tara:strand:- start:3216 stop:3737 length:522 start_codon:yes stop_codon:yes gene_type:complete
MVTTPRNYWMVAVHEDYYQVCADRKFSVLGMGKQQRKRVQRMEIGDRVLFYVYESATFCAIASISETYFEDETIVWPITDKEDSYSWHVKINADITLDDAHAIDARLIAPRLEYVKKWAPELWPLAFQGLLHLIPKKDFLLIEHEMYRGVKRPEVKWDYDPRHGPLAREAQHS